MTNKEILSNKITTNEDLLANLKKKKENLEKQIAILERKINNQKATLMIQGKEKKDAETESQLSENSQ